MKKTSIKIALVQMQCVNNNHPRNLANIRRYIQRAVTSHAEIICFPEMSISGYDQPDKNHDCVLALKSSIIKSFVKLTKDNRIIAIAGFIEKNPANPKPFISQIIAARGKIIGIYRKRNIVNDEARYFSPPTPNKGQTFTIKPGLKIGLAVCADIDYPPAFADPAKMGAKIIFHSSAPDLYKKRTSLASWERGYEWWRQQCQQKLGKYAQQNNVYILSTTQCGTVDRVDYPGGMYVFDSTGRCIIQSNDFRESSIIFDLTF